VEQLHFLALARQAAALATRRDTLRTLAGAIGLAAGTAPASGTAATCLRNGKECKRGNQCCSGFCKRGKGDKKRCRKVSSASTCTIRDDLCVQPPGGPFVDCGVGSVLCACLVTTAGRAFCADPLQTFVECETNADCVAEIGRGTVCVKLRTGPSCNSGPPVKNCFRRCADPV
jgi:hypothetical protein